jgi:hypothetical protein
MPGVAPAPRSKTVDRDAERRPAKYHDQSPRHWISGRGGTGMRWSRHGEVTLGALKFLAPRAREEQGSRTPGGVDPVLLMCGFE